MLNRRNIVGARLLALSPMEIRPPSRAEIGEFLLKAREAAQKAATPDKRSDYAQASVAAMLGVREAAVRSWEKGRTAPDADLLFRLVYFYRADILQLLSVRVRGGGGAGAEQGRTRKTG